MNDDLRAFFDRETKRQERQLLWDAMWSMAKALIFAGAGAAIAIWWK